ncbi:hypothetical protein WHR41_07520 [Cladosporium halotolerans]|uniref:Mitochondrial export protein Som1 n=1 Tax=Cladosporium halotolerans TaxID=1052096 RepID=A0AB34KIA3_9PEZI
MAPLVESFPASQLTTRVQYVANGQRRKPPVDLKECELMQMIQHRCDLDGPRFDPRSKVVCDPVLRLFRKCSDKLTVETTDWEDIWDGTTPTPKEK